MKRSKWLFSDGDLAAALDAHARGADKKIAEIPDESLRDLDTQSLIDNFVAEYSVEPLRVDADGVEKHIRETDVDVSGDPHRHIRDRSRPHHVKGYEFSCEYPYTGDTLLWRMRPNAWSSVQPQAEVRGDPGDRNGKIRISTVVAGSPNPDQLVRDVDRELETIQKYIEWQRTQVSVFNANLADRIRTSIDARADRLRSATDLAAALGAKVVGRDRGSSAAPSGNPVVKTRVEQPVTQRKQHDLFISHASEDKEGFVRPLAAALRKLGLDVWLDETELKLGDSLRRTIDKGLAGCRFGVVVLSPRFFAKSWPQYELDGLVAREINGVKVILPIWLDISRDEVIEQSPTLADRLAADASRTALDEIAAQIAAVVKG